VCGIDRHSYVLEINHRTATSASAAGSGTDTRAWRLPWPAGFKVFEVDSPAVLAFKARVLSGAAAAAADGQQQQQQQQGEVAVQPKLQCEQRVEVPADASRPEGEISLAG
jgi:hypothetical protein